VDLDGFLWRTSVWQRARRRAAGSTKAQEDGQKRQSARCSCKTQDKFAIASMAKKLLHRCIGAHARVVEMYIYIYMCVCIYIHIYVYVHIYAYVYIYISLYISMCMCMYVNIYLCINPCQNGRKMTSFRGAVAKLGAGVDNELGGLGPH